MHRRRTNLAGAAPSRLVTATTALTLAAASSRGALTLRPGDDVFNLRIRFSHRHRSRRRAEAVACAVERLESRQLMSASDVGAAQAVGMSPRSASAVDDAAAMQPRILLAPSVMASLRQKVVADTTQWRAFRDRLDEYLPQPIGPSGYQGSQLELISDFALGYRLLKDDPATVATAEMYADKAIAILKSGLNDYQRGSDQTRQWLARGDGVTTSFVLPGQGIVDHSLRVFISPVRSRAVVHGGLDQADWLGPVGRILQVSLADGDSSRFVERTDWIRNPRLINGLIDWSPPGAEPAIGGEYLVSFSSPSDDDTMIVPRDASNYTGGNYFRLAGGTLTLARPLGSDEAVFVEYVYGTHAADYSTLSFQQSSAGDGGFNSIFVDTGYTSRYLGKHLAMGLDWLYDYPGLSDSLKQQTSQRLVDWSDHLATNGYLVNSPASNYGAGSYVSRVLSAVALSGGRDPIHGPRLINDVLAYRDGFVKPALTNPTRSLLGGFWAEGWNYGALAVQNILLAEQALESAGLASEVSGRVPGATERQWASDVLLSLINEQPTPQTIYDGGDSYSYPAAFPTRNLVSLLTHVVTDPELRRYGNHILQNYDAPLTPNFSDLLFRDPYAPAAFWSTLPREHNSSGQGLVTARADWSYDSTWMAFQLGNLIEADHQTHSPGHLQIQRGADPLLANAQAVAEIQSPSERSQFANIVVIDSHGDVDSRGNPIQTYPFATGSWYGAPGVFQTAFDATDRYVYIAGDYHAAYRNPDGDSPATQLARQVVYLRPDIVVVHDRVETQADTYTKQLRWHFINQPEVRGNAFVESIGTSRLFGRTFSSVDVATRVRAFNSRDADGNVVNPTGYTERPFYELITENVEPVSALTYTTAFQTAPASTPDMLDTSRVICAGGTFEGVRIGTSLVLFGRDGEIIPAVDTISCSLPATFPSLTVVVGLLPGQTYRIELNGQSQLVTANEHGTTSTMAFGNQAPELDDSGTPYLIAPAGSRLPAALLNGTLVSDLLSRGAGGNPIFDSDPGALRGIAVTSIDNSFGQWQFTLAASPREVDWINVESAGPISDASALLLPADSAARLRYVTNLMPHHFAGVDVLALESRLVRGLTFRAWDQTTGTAGGRANAGSNGGSTAFSSDSETVGTYFETRLFRSFNPNAGLNTYTLEREFHALVGRFGYEDRSMSADGGFTILMSPIAGLSMLPLYRLYFGVAFNADGTQTDMGLRYLTTDLAEARSLESLGPPDRRDTRSGSYFRELGVNDGTGILGYIFATSQPGTVAMSQIYRTDLVTRSHRRVSDGTPAGSSLQEHGDHVYTSRPALEMSRYGTWRQEAHRGFVRELAVTGSGSQQPARSAALHAAIELPTIATARARQLHSGDASHAALPALLATARDAIAIDARPQADRDRLVAARQRSGDSPAVIVGPAQLRGGPDRRWHDRRVPGETEVQLVDSVFSRWSDLVEHLSWDAERAAAPGTLAP